MLPNFPRADADNVTQRPDERSHDDLDSIIAHYRRVSAAEKKLARTIDHSETERQNNQPPIVLQALTAQPTDRIRRKASFLVGFVRIQPQAITLPPEGILPLGSVRVGWSNALSNASCPKAGRRGRRGDAACEALEIARATLANAARANCRAIGR